MIRTRYLIPVLFTLSLLAAGPAGTQVLSITADQFIDSLEIGGEKVIYAHPIGYVEGLDYPGEWVEYTLAPSEYGTHITQIIVRGLEETVFDIEMTITGDISSEVQTMSFNFTGQGCG